MVFPALRRPRNKWCERNWLARGRIDSPVRANRAMEVPCAPNRPERVTCAGIVPIFRFVSLRLDTSREGIPIEARGMTLPTIPVLQPSFGMEEADAVAE